MIVAGRSERDPRLGAALAAFADRAGVPLLADPLSGARRGPAAIAHYDALLRDPWRRARAGARPARRRPPDLQAAAHVAGRARRAAGRFDPENAWQDPAGSVGTIVAADPRTTLEALAEAAAGKRKDTSWLDALARRRPRRVARDRVDRSGRPG